MIGASATETVRPRHFGHRIGPAVPLAAHARLEMAGVAEAAPRIAAELGALVRADQRTAGLAHRSHSTHPCLTRAHRKEAPSPDPEHHLGNERQHRQLDERTHQQCQRYQRLVGKGRHRDRQRDR